MDHPRHAADLYETSPEAVEMLLRHVPLQGPVLEPSAGRGAIVRELRKSGLEVHASDLHDHQANALGIETGVDFLSTTTTACNSIVMNPPFRDAEARRHALQLLPDGGRPAAYDLDRREGTRRSPAMSRHHHRRAAENAAGRGIVAMAARTSPGSS
jgi:hypothetical protein